jgi:hypothetical protein
LPPSSLRLPSFESRRLVNSNIIRREARVDLPALRFKSRSEIAMSQLLRFPTSVKRDPAIDVWMREHSGELGAIAQGWFEIMRDCGDDVRELLHDGHPTACVGDAAFGYVNAFKAHVNVGFFVGLNSPIRRVCWKALASSCVM